MKRYEGLFILNTAAKEESVKDIIDAISAEIVAADGKVETVQKMDKRAFMRVADKKHTSGFYVNVIFEAGPTAVGQLRTRFGLNKDVFRVLFSEAPALAAATAAA
jgi:ribosomal protein S6